MLLNKAVALITGGAQGFGRKFAENLLQRGAKVIVADIDIDAGEKFQNDSLTQFGENKMKFLKCDVTDSKELKETFEAAKACFGRLDIVCNNAGTLSLDPQRIRAQVDINLTAVIEGTYKGIDLMSKQNGGDGGVIVNVASAAGLNLMKGAAVYTATKHAVVAFTRSFKFLPHYKIDGIRVNCICPFFCNTELLKKGLEEYPEGMEIIRKVGMVEIDDVAKGFMKCIENDEINAGVIVIAPPNKIFEMKIPLSKM